ncbi:haloacid dehalogenase superfamily, subfamily IA, variant 1 with third motif having Dx(3-4)D or Dx(3-4)E [Paenibacillus uliginis N3/975]|uniref:Haloacid dehalogenase superfamily, subfamily IA, variant 1 with third motif having Dx(3-4)D or Dx(3-4)E n=1 Tax=Paenibacillus uliginis N3/975 TaxID=1313296 RepID=A0A1X7HIN5_9BACL|nr:HAD family hydrolase [Paenibacillus uliginis]SMF86998.1 haloacid dehalogenase superfamily, subfamily IA, variant 1 with third motif having Dx(3-4)D or Dx(3-4)E [Paenibacillus uliginis N3/975]
MYNTFIFDIDGTLIDTEQAVLSSLQKLLKVDYDRDIDLKDLNFALGIPGMYALQQLGIDDMNQALDRWDSFMKEYYSTIDVFSGIKELLDELKKQSVMKGVVTSKTDQEFSHDFVPFGLTGHFPHVVCADDTELHKPHPEPLFKFLEISGADAMSSIYIGDTIYDYECARDAGIDFGLALWGCKNHEAIPAKYKFEKPLDILTLLHEEGTVTR